MKQCPPLRVRLPIPSEWKQANKKMIENHLTNQNKTESDDEMETDKRDRLQQVMEKINRGVFCPSKLIQEKFQMNPCPLVPGKATLSAFSVHWEATRLILKHWLLNGFPEDRDHVKILDVGSGSGYLLAVFDQLLKDFKLQGEVVGVELLPELVEFSLRQLCLFYPKGHIRVEGGDGWLGDPHYDDIPFDVINVGATATGIPLKLWQQLAPGGVMIIPLECTKRKNQYLYTIVKDPETLKPIATRGMSVRYVPLVPTGGISHEWTC